MGFSTLIDILGAAIIGGMVMLSVRALILNSSEKSNQFQNELIAQQNLVSIVELIEHDFARIGYCENADSIEAPEDMIVYADSTKISFKTDFAQGFQNIRGDGTKDILTYELGPTITSTPNPYDRLLYRYAKGETKNGSNLGITEFRLNYFDNMGNELSHPIDTKLISYVQIDIKVEDSYGYDTGNDEKIHSEKYPTIFWRQIRVAAKNMSR